MMGRAGRDGAIDVAPFLVPGYHPTSVPAIPLLSHGQGVGSPSSCSARAGMDNFSISPGSPISRSPSQQLSAMHRLLEYFAATIWWGSRLSQPPFGIDVGVAWQHGSFCQRPGASAVPRPS